eukprot:gene15306-18109_t
MTNKLKLLDEKVNHLYRMKFETAGIDAVKKEMDVLRGKLVQYVLAVQSASNLQHWEKEEDDENGSIADGGGATGVIWMNDEHLEGLEHVMLNVTRQLKELRRRVESGSHYSGTHITEIKMALTELQKMRVMAAE